MPVLPGAEPFSSDGSRDVGVLVSHGFTGSPYSVRGWAQAFADAGYTVRAPRLPGHGTTWQEMNRTTWREWYGCLRREVQPLLDECETVILCGLSMGGTLTLHLAAELGDAVDGLVLVNPSVMTKRLDAKFLPVLKYLLPFVKGIGSDIAKPGVTELAYDRTPVRAAASLAQLWPIVRSELPTIAQPLLLLHSATDHVVEPENARIVLDTVASSDVTEVVLDNSYHVATLDHDAELIARRSLEFVDRIRSATPKSPQG